MTMEPKNDIRFHSGGSSLDARWDVGDSFWISARRQWTDDTCEWLKRRSNCLKCVMRSCTRPDSVRLLSSKVCPDTQCGCDLVS